MILESKNFLAANETIAKVLSLTSAGNVYEASPSEIADNALPSTALGALTSSYTLEQSSNPAFKVTNRGAAEIYHANMGGYMLIFKNGKAFAAKLNPNDWDLFADGTSVGDASRFETMVHVPPCNFKADGQTMHFGGIIPIDGGHTFDSPQWVGAYKMFVDPSGFGHSRPDVAPTHSRNMTSFQTAAQKTLGNEGGQANYGFHCLINALTQARYGNLNTQSIMGAGFQHSNWEACRDVPMGLLRKLGDGTGNVLYNDATIGNQYPVKSFGFEDLWSKLWEFRPGIRFYMDGDVRKAVHYPGNQVSNTAAGREFVTVQVNGYAKNMVLGEYWDIVPSNVVGAGSSTFYCDHFWANTTGELMRVGGAADFGASCGLSCAYSYYGFSDSWTDIGSRLAFYGQPEIVSGAQLVAMLA